MEKSFKTVQKMNELKKQFSDLSKLNYCLLCNKPIDGTCKSHVIPQFVLKNIAKDGIVMPAFAGKELLPLFIKDSGVKNAGIIKRICPVCDNKDFKKYENPKILMQKPSDEILNLIALKTTLRMLDKKLLEKPSNDYVKQKGRFTPLEKFHDYDKNEWWEDLNRLKKVLNGKKFVKYKLVFWSKLEYVVPIACQTAVSLYGDLEGHIVNDIFSLDKHKKTQNLHIAIFPLAECSIVMMFHYLSDLKYRAFDIQFEKLSLDEKLSLITYIVISYTEDYFISPFLANKLTKNSIEAQQIHEISNNLHINFCLKEEYEEFKKDELQELKNRKPMPNLLGIQYALPVNKFEN